MNIKIILHRHFINYTPSADHIISMTLMQPCSVEELAVQVGIQPCDIGIYFVNQKIKSKNTLVAEGDIIEFYPQIEGG